MKIAIAQINTHIGDFDGNFVKMKSYIEGAQNSGADIICFPELATSGYPPRDFLNFDDFIKESKMILDKLAELSGQIAIVVGSPVVNPVIEGKDLFNAAVVLYQGKIQHVHHKSLLPTYDVFDEYRYFEPGRSFKLWQFKGKKIAFTICEDIWNIGNKNPLYSVCPLDEMIDLKPDFVLNLSASPFSYDHAKKRIEVLKANADRYKVPIFYVNHVGAQTELIFDGGSIVMSPSGQVFDEMPYFQEALNVYDLDEVVFNLDNNEQKKDKIELIHDAIVMGIKDYFQKLGFSKAILGLSGGIDSAVTAALAIEALGAENVKAILMPSRFSSDHSISDSVVMAKNYQMPYEIIPIKDAYNTFLETLNPFFEGRSFDVTEENLQARIRGVLLMAMSNKFGYILLNTSNKSEAAVGYGTLYGDMCGGLSVIGDVYKVDVYALARYINRFEKMIPENMITKPPSAELRPDQKDSDSLPDYEILDQILFQYIDEEADPKDILQMGFDEKMVKKVLRLVNMNEFKRYQTAPILRISNKAFGMGRRMPIVGKYLS